MQLQPWFITRNIHVCKIWFLYGPVECDREYRMWRPATTPITWFNTSFIYSNPGETSLNCAHTPWDLCQQTNLFLPWSSSYNDDHHLNINCTFCKLCLCGLVFTALGRYKPFAAISTNYVFLFIRVFYS